MLGGLAAAVAIIFFVTAHEAGHFLAAKAVGMKVTQFFFGFGPKIWSTHRGETEYGFKWLPLGGYVRIVGMNPMEDVEPDDMGRTYREKKFWEKSFVVLAGVGMNFLIAFLIFYGLALSQGVAVPQTEIDRVVETAVVGGEEVVSPAFAAGLKAGDRILMVGGEAVTSWDDVTKRLAEIGGAETSIVVDRGGGELTLQATLIEQPAPEGGTTGYLGIGPSVVIEEVGVFEGIGIAGQTIGQSIRLTFASLLELVRPSNLAQYLGVFVGNTDVDPEVRPVSPIGIVNIGSQAQTAGSFLAVLALVNVALASINLLPLFPLDGGHFAVALYEKVTRREANVQRLIPVAAAVIGIFVFLGVVGIILDIANPIAL